MKRIIICLLAVAALPTGVALAQGTPRHGRSAPRIRYILTGTLSTYTQATDGAAGSITIDVNHASYRARALKSQSLTFSLTAKSRVTFRRGSHAHHEIADGTRGYLTLWAPKRITGDLVTQLPALATRIHVVVLRAPAAP